MSRVQAAGGVLGRMATVDDAADEHPMAADVERSSAAVQRALSDLHDAEAGTAATVEALRRENAELRTRLAAAELARDGALKKLQELRGRRAAVGGGGPTPVAVAAPLLSAAAGAAAAAAAAAAGHGGV